MESIIPMTAGLLLDICGGFLILKPIMFFSNIRLFRDFYTISPFVNYRGDDWKHFIKELEEKIIENKDEDKDKSREYAREVKWGFTFLSVGFFLILIAGWMTHLDHIS